MPIVRSALPVAAAVLVSVLISGCASGEDETDSASSSQELRGGHGEHGGGGHGGHGHHSGGQPWHGHGAGPELIAQPQGAYFANVTANGTGCPDGSWDVDISPDGETFTLRFNAYEAKVSPGEGVDVKDCQLDIKLASPQGTSFSVASFTYQGYAFLEKNGMTARQTASYFFDRNRETNADRNQLTGPVDQSYTFASDIDAPHRAWSPCRRDESLHVRTRLMMRNDRQATGEGYINSAVVDGALFQWKMQWRRCPGG